MNNCMTKKILLIALLVSAVNTIMYGQDSISKRNDWNKVDLSNRANDHFMLQFGYDGWAGKADSMNTSGFSRHFNFYLMIDKPFKANPAFSVAFGAGLASSNIFFSTTYIDLKSTSATLPFKDVSAANHFDKYKFSTMFIEVPIELRLVGNPVQPDKGFKIALGVKGGYLLNAYTKGKNLLDSTGQSVYGETYKSNEYEKKFINNTRFATTARIGIGNISIDGSYQLTPLLKEGTGPKINPWSLGITISGL